MPSQLPGINVLLMGESGTGKTYAIRTLIDAGITPFCIFLEPGFEVLGDIPPEKLHWRYIKPGSSGWTTLQANHEKLNTFSFKMLADMPPPDKAQYHQFVDLLKALNNFVCDRTGECFGDTLKWNTDRALVIDGLSGLSLIAMREWVGSKNLLSQGDWGVAMAGIEQFIQQLCYDVTSHVVLIAHTERELDETAGVSKIMTSTLGKKLAPKIPRFFSDVILAKREGSKFSWDTADSSAALKARNLPIASGQSPSFVPLITKWKAQGGTIVASEKGTQ